MNTQLYCTIAEVMAPATEKATQVTAPNSWSPSWCPSPKSPQWRQCGYM